MAGNAIYRGPVAKEPQTTNLPVDGTPLPGVFVEAEDGNLTVATTALGQRVYLLSNRRFYNQSLADAYAAGETGVAYEVLPGSRFQARVAAATYAVGDPLTVGPSGYLTAAAAGTVVVAFYDGAAGAITVGTLVDVIIANGYTVPV